jgi:hypothetical protein
MRTQRAVESAARGCCAAGWVMKFRTIWRNGEKRSRAVVRCAPGLAEGATQPGGELVMLAIFLSARQAVEGFPYAARPRIDLDQ